MQKRKWKTQIWWFFQLGLLCIMVSTPLWIKKDFGLLVTPTSLGELGNDTSLFSSTLQSTQVLQLQIEKPASEEDVFHVNTKQIRFQSRAFTDRGILAKISPVKAVRLDRKAKQKSERWWLSRIDRKSDRAPASLNEEIKILSFDEDEYVSEYLELNEGLNEFLVHYTSSNSQKKSKVLKVFLK